MRAPRRGPEGYSIPAQLKLLEEQSSGRPSGWNRMEQWGINSVRVPIRDAA